MTEGLVASYWFEPGRLMAGQYPGSQDPKEARHKIRFLLDRGVRRFVDLTEEGEVTWRGEPLLPYADLLAAEARRQGVSAFHRRFPIRDMEVPTVALMRAVLAYLGDSVAANEVAYVHCLGGKGRTGTVVACYLAEHTEWLSDPREAARTVQEAALRHVTRLRRDQRVPEPEDSPQTEVQFRFVHDWPIRG